MHALEEQERVTDSASEFALLAGLNGMEDATMFVPLSSEQWMHALKYALQEQPGKIMSACLIFKTARMDSIITPMDSVITVDSLALCVLARQLPVQLARMAILSSHQPMAIIANLKAIALKDPILKAPSACHALKNAVLAEVQHNA